MSEFTVRPSVLRSAGGDLYDLAATVTQAGALVDSHLFVRRGGSVLDSLAGEVDDVRADLDHAYSAGGPIALRLYLAGFALRDIGIDYEEVDLKQAARYDARLDGRRSTPVPWTTNRPGVSEGSYDRHLTGSPEHAFEEFDAFQNIGDVVEDIIAFEWIGGVYDKVGLPNPIAPIKKALEGDWEQVGRCIGALRMLVEYEVMLRNDLDGVIKQLSGAWTGNAADVAIGWVDDFADAVRTHKNALNKQGQRIKAEALALKVNLDNLFDVIDLTTKAIPTPGELAGILSNPVGGVKQILHKLVKYAELIKEAFDLALGAGFGVVAAFSQITRFWDAEFPRVPGLERPDVNGPAA